MCGIEQLKIDIKALPEGETTFSVDLNDEFFASVDSQELSQGDMHVDVSIRKTIHFSEVSFHAAGTAKVTCDRCLDLMDQPIDCDQRFMVKLGSEYSDEDELIVLEEENPILDLVWFVYEAIVLNIPVKHVHAPGKCNPAMINVLNEHSATRSDDGDITDEDAIDPRWSKLRNLKLDE